MTTPATIPQLPTEITSIILASSRPEDWQSIRRVCHTWRDIGDAVFDLRALSAGQKWYSVATAQWIRQVCHQRHVNCDDCRPSLSDIFAAISGKKSHANVIKFNGICVCQQRQTHICKRAEKYLLVDTSIEMFEFMLKWSQLHGSAWERITLSCILHDRCDKLVVAFDHGTESVRKFIQSALDDFMRHQFDHALSYFDPNEADPLPGKSTYNLLGAGHEHDLKAMNKLLPAAMPDQKMVMVIALTQHRRREMSAEMQEYVIGLTGIDEARVEHIRLCCA